MATTINDEISHIHPSNLTRGGMVLPARVVRWPTPQVAGTEYPLGPRKKRLFVIDFWDQPRFPARFTATTASQQPNFYTIKATQATMPMIRIAATAPTIQFCRRALRTESA